MPQSTNWANPNFSGNTPSGNTTTSTNTADRHPDYYYAPPKKPKKKKRDASKTTLLEGVIGTVGSTIGGTVAGEIIGTAAYKHNLWRRERFIRINKLENKMSTMDPDYIGSKLGREELDRVSKGDYKKSITAPQGAPDDDKLPGGTVKSDTSILGSESKIQKDAVKKSPDGPAISEMAQLQETEAERLLKIKRKGRKKTKLLKDTEDLTLSKKVLLG